MFPKFQFGAEITRTGLAMVHRHEIISPVKNLAAQGIRLPERRLNIPSEITLDRETRDRLRSVVEAKPVTTVGAIHMHLSFPYAKITKSEIDQIVKAVHDSIDNRFNRERGAQTYRGLNK